MALQWFAVLLSYLEFSMIRWSLRFSKMFEKYKIIFVYVDVDSTLNTQENQQSRKGSRTFWISNSIPNSMLNLCNRNLSLNHFDSIIQLSRLSLMIWFHFTSHWKVQISFKFIWIAGCVMFKYDWKTTRVDC